MTTNLFELATRQAFRFPSTKGELTVEDLWNLPLTSERNNSLDKVARAVNAELRECTTESFVETAPKPGQVELNSKLEIVKHIIAVKIAENQETARRAAARQERDRLMDILADKEQQQLLNLSREELIARIDALSV